MLLPHLSSFLPSLRHRNIVVPVSIQFHSLVGRHFFSLSVFRAWFIKFSSIRCALLDSPVTQERKTELENSSSTHLELIGLKKRKKNFSKQNWITIRLSLSAQNVRSDRAPYLSSLSTNILQSTVTFKSLLLPDMITLGAQTTRPKSIHRLFFLGSTQIPDQRRSSSLNSRLPNWRGEEKKPDDWGREQIVTWDSPTTVATHLTHCTPDRPASSWSSSPLPHHGELMGNILRRSFITRAGKATGVLSCLLLFCSQIVLLVRPKLAVPFEEKKLKRILRSVTWRVIYLRCLIHVPKTREEIQSCTKLGEQVSRWVYLASRAN